MNAFINKWYSNMLFRVLVHKVKVAFCQKVWWGSKEYSKRLPSAENLNFPPIIVNNFFKFSAQESDLEYFFEPHRTFWQKATFSSFSGGAAWMQVYVIYIKVIYPKYYKHEIYTLHGLFSIPFVFCVFCVQLIKSIKIKLRLTFTY